MRITDIITENTQGVAAQAEDHGPDMATSLRRLGKFHPGVDPLAEFVPERASAQYALHPDKWHSTFYSLTNKDPDKLRYYGPTKTSIPPGTLVGDMAIANQFYRAKTSEEKQRYAELYRASLQPYPVDVTKYRMPELLMPRQEVTEGPDRDFVQEYETGTGRSREIERTLKQAGYRRLGGGFEATAWSRNDGRVIKIIMPSGARSGTAQKTFVDFYQMTKKTPSPHWPRFYEMQDQAGRSREFAHFQIQGQPYMQIAMERLRQLTPLEVFIVGVLSDYVGRKDWASADRRLRSSNSAPVREYASEHQDQLQSLFDIIKLSKDQGQALGYTWDLHGDNVMKRADGTLVVTDPWINRSQQ